MPLLLKFLMLSSVIVFCAVVPAVRAQEATKGKTVAANGLATLYAIDPVSQSFSFTENHAGKIIQNHRPLNNNGEIDFGGYRRNCVTVGISTDTAGAIVDLGTVQSLEEKYQYHETVGGGQGFASIRRKGQHLLIGHEPQDDNRDETQELKEATEHLQAVKKVNSSEAFLGHVYLIHIVKTDRGNGPTDLYVKMLIVAFQPDQSITIRWEVLADE